MQAGRVDGARALGAPPRSTLIAIGNFDGVHRGHQAVLRRAASEAAERGLAPYVLTFDPHPVQVLFGYDVETLTPTPRKIELVRQAAESVGVIVEPFSQHLAEHTPAQFAERLLAKQLGAALVIVGDNFRFGHKRAGDLSTLVELGRELGFEARAEPLEGDEIGPISSTRVRGHVKAGELEAARRLLGRPHALTGLVVKGDQRGRTLGFPTANLNDVEELLPPHGVYATLVDELDTDGRATRLGTGVTNVGVRPTVKAGRSIETHLFDFDQDLYGKRLRLHLLEQQRSEKKFSGLDELKQQIAQDAARARDVTASETLPPQGEPWF